MYEDYGDSKPIFIANVSRVRTMTLPKFVGPSQFARITRSTNKSMEEVTGLVYVDEITSIESESISLTQVKE
jgi:hypothetical protein